ncbi:MAG TPA: hypothetical protein VFY23_04625 [Candidatus Limnocylindrales bacterium]|nr:hypothetical protein [Candidatus Limnocylindrales bacterium]
MAELPPSDGRPPRADRPFVVEPGAARPARRSRLPVIALGLAVVLVVGLSAWGLSAPAPPDGIRDPSGRPDAMADPSTPTVPPAPGDGTFADVTASTDDEAFAALGVLGGWRTCPMWRGFGEGSTVSAEAVAATLAGVTDPEGMHLVPDALGQPQRIWIGGSAHDVARGFGGGAVARVEDGGDAFWTGIPAAGGWAAVRIEPMLVDRLGRFAWQVRERALPAPYCLFDSVGGPQAHVERVPASANPVDRLFIETGWAVCRTWMRMEIAATPSLEAIDAEIDRLGLGAEAGWLPLTLPGSIADRQVPVWIGDDPAVGAARHGSRLAVVAGEGERRVAWIATELEGRPLAVAFDVVRTPGGRTVWLPTNDAAGVTGDCDLAALPAAGDPVRDSPSAAPDPGSGVVARPGRPVEILRGAAARDMLTARFGWERCRMTAIETYGPAPDAAAIDAAAGEQGVEAGPLRLEPEGGAPGAWIGGDIVELARWQQAAVVAVDATGVAWLGNETRADAWAVLTTPEGRVAWISTGNATWPDGCELASARAGLEALRARSFTCWTDRDRCLEAIDAARRSAPEAFEPGMDVAAGLGEDCPALQRCAWDGPTQLVYVTAVPAAWRSPDELRAFATGVRRFARASGELRPASITPAIRGLASRPSLGLHVAPPDAAAAACPPFGIDGRLRGSPWEPGVASVDSNAVQWPAGFVARFVPDVELVAPDGRVYRAGERVQVSGTAGMAPGFVACAVTLVESAGPLPSGP